jgi:hypothetical protein
VQRRTILVIFLGLLLVAVVLGTGCSPKGPAWVDAGNDYSSSNVSSVYSRADISSLSAQSAADTAQARHDALTELRKRGGAASSAADLITKTLPSNERGIPVYVERATFGGKPAILLVEAIGPAGGKLNTKRLWVFSDTGAVLYVGTR